MFIVISQLFDTMFKKHRRTINGSCRDVLEYFLKFVLEKKIRLNRVKLLFYKLKYLLMTYMFPIHCTVCTKIHMGTARRDGTHSNEKGLLMPNFRNIYFHYIKKLLFYLFPLNSNTQMGTT